MATGNDACVAGEAKYSPTRVPPGWNAVEDYRTTHLGVRAALLPPWIQAPTADPAPTPLPASSVKKRKLRCRTLHLRVRQFAGTLDVRVVHGKRLGTLFGRRVRIDRKIYFLKPCGMRSKRPPIIKEGVDLSARCRPLGYASERNTGKEQQHCHVPRRRGQNSNDFIAQ